MSPSRALRAPAPDWHAVGRAVAAAQARAAPQGDGLTLWAATYGMAAEVAFYTPRRPRVFSGSNQYALWGLPAAPDHTLLFIGPADGLDQIAPIPGHAAPRPTVVAGVRLTILPRLPEGTARVRAQKLRALTAFGYWRAATCLPARRD